jgi:hypothetical protein
MKYNLLINNSKMMLQIFKQILKIPRNLCIILLVLYFVDPLQARIGPTTTYDGETYNYNTFLNFDGSTGLRFSE